MKSLLVKIAERNTDTLWSWVVCLSSFLIQLIVIGIQNSFGGTIFVALLEKFGRGESETVWVGTTAIGLTFFCGPLSTYLCHRYGCRIVACTGSVLLAISGFLTSLVKRISLMYFTFGVLNGLASSLLFFSSLVALIDYFHKYLPTASGVSVSGSGVGTVIMTLLLQQLLSRYGLKIAFQAVAGMAAVCFVAGLAYAPLKPPKEINLKDSLKEFPNHSLLRVNTENEKNKMKGCLRSFKFGKHWKNKGFVVWTIAMSLIMFVCYIPLMYIVLVAEKTGVPLSKGGFLISIFAICSTVGKITVGKLANLKCANRLKMAQTALLLMAVSTCLLPFAKSYGALVAYSTVQGFFDGSYAVLTGLITNDIVGKEMMAGAVASVYFVVSIPMTIGPPIAGILYDHLGDYNTVFFLSGALVFVGMVIMFLIPWLTPPTLSKPNIKQESTPVESKTFSNFINGNRYDMSCVDEKNLANLLDESLVNHLRKRNRSLLDGSFTDSKRSSFVLFTIVSEENQRDISAYSSYQDLASNADTEPHFSSSIRNFFHGSHSSLFSTNHSVIEAPILESIPEVANDPRNSETCVLIEREDHLENVQETKEIEKIIEEDGAKAPPTQIDIVIVMDNLEDIKQGYEESDTKETDKSDKITDGGVAEQRFVSNLSCESNKSSSQLSTGTADSGFDEWRDEFLDKKSDSTSVVERQTVSEDFPFRSCSCMNLSVPSEAKAKEVNLHTQNVLTSHSQDLTDRCHSRMDTDSYGNSDVSLHLDEIHDRFTKKGNVSIEFSELFDSYQSEDDYYDDVVLNLYPEVEDELADERRGDIDILKNNG